MNVEQANWVVAGPRSAAVRLGMKPSTFYFLMRKPGIFRAHGRGKAVGMNRSTLHFRMKKLGIIPSNDAEIQRLSRLGV
jgi:transcriptional regulator of acetoin/glycerol metabolism